MPEHAGYLPGLERENAKWTQKSYGTEGTPLEVLLPSLETEQLVSMAQHIRQQATQHLKTIPVEQIVEAIDRTIARLLDRQDFHRRRMDALLPTVTGYDAEMVQLGLSGYLKTFRKPQLRRFLAEDFANPAILDSFQPLAKGGFGRAFSPGVLGHIWAGNVPGLPLWSLVAGLLVKSGNLGKVSTSEPLFAGWFAEALAEVEPALAECIGIVWWRGGETELETALTAESDIILGYGSNEALAAIQARVPTGKRFLAYGHKVSFAIVSTAALDTDKATATARLAAYDVARYDQQGCYSPQMIYVECGGRVSPQKFAQFLSHELAAIEKKFPRRKLTITEANALASWRHDEEMKFGGEIFGDETGSWTVSFHMAESNLMPSSLNRAIRVVGVERLADVPAMIAPFKSLLQTVGIAAAPEHLFQLADALGNVGVTRICALGDMTTPEAGWHHDGRFNLSDLVTITEIDHRAEFAADRLAPYAE